MSWLLETAGAYKDLLTVLLALGGLLWAFLSFYFLHWRKGKLVVSGPRSYMAAVAPSRNRIIVDLPLTFYNDGAAPIVIQNLSLELLQGDHTHRVRFNATREELGAKDQTWATQIAVEGRTAASLVCSFQTGDLKERFRFAPEDCECTLWARLDRQGKWTKLLQFSLAMDEKAIELINRGQFVAHDNYAEDRPA